MKNLRNKFIMILGLIFASVLLTGCNQNSGSGKVGVIDMQQLLQSPAIQNMEQELMKQAAPEQAKLKQAYQAVMDTRNKLTKASAANKKQLQDQLKSQEANFSSMMQAAQQNQQKQEHDLQEKINEAIGKIADSEGLNYVYVKQVVLFGKAEDITDKVIHQLS